MYLTLKQQVKHLSKKEFRNLKYLSHIAKNLTNEAIIILDNTILIIKSI